MEAKLVAEFGDMKGLILSLEEGEEWIIGRDPDACQILIEDPSVSREHLKCQKTEAGFIVENLSETSPVEINEKVIKKPTLLKHSDVIKIGGSAYRFFTITEAVIVEEEQEAEEIEKEVEEATREEEKEKIEKEAEPEKEIEEEAQEIEHDTIYEETAEEDKGILAEIDFDLRETGRYLLKVIGGPNNGAEFSMQSEESYLIGTDPSTCDVVFHDTSVSRQHARINISSQEIMTIEDLKSKNGTLLDGEKLETKATLESNTLITMGTTSFIIFDREGDMQTIISPLLPSIVKVLQKEEEKIASTEKKGVATETALPAETEEQAQKKISAFIVIGIISTLFVFVGIGTMTLFHSETIQIKKKENAEEILKRAFAPFTSVKYSFNKHTGTLLLVGHALTASDKNQLLYNLQGYDFIKDIDDSGLIIDEYVWREINQILNRDPRWKGISIHSPQAGIFILSGYLQRRSQAKDLSDYITANFPYLDILERKVIVEEDVITKVEINLDRIGIKNIDVQMNNGQLSISGGLGKEHLISLNRLIPDLRQIPGVRNVKTFINELEPEQTIINISDRYQVSGTIHSGGVSLNVVINGKILSRGDVLDGMTITSIRPNAIFLEKDGVKYRIDY